MPYITTDILCNGVVWLRKTDVQIAPVKPSAYDKETFIAGRIELPVYKKVNPEAAFSIKMPDGTDKEIVLTDFPASLEQSEIRFEILESLPFEVFLPFEKV